MRHCGVYRRAVSRLRAMAAPWGLGDRPHSRRERTIAFRHTSDRADEGLLGLPRWICGNGDQSITIAYIVKAAGTAALTREIDACEWSSPEQAPTPLAFDYAHMIRDYRALMKGRPADS